MSFSSTNSLTAIVVAVEEEYRAIKARMPRAETESAGGISILRGELGAREIVLAKSGMGSERAFRTAKAVIEACSPSELIIAGFCAGLSEAVAPGDLVVATRVVAPESSRCPAHPECASDVSAGNQGESLTVTRLPDPSMLALAVGISDTTARLHQGVVYCTDRVLRSRSEKRDIIRGEAFLAADMESYGAAAAAEQLSVPWLTVRAVTDGVEDDLPLDFELFVDDSGEAARSKIAAHVALRPWLALALVRLGARSATAARNLATFLERFMETH